LGVFSHHRSRVFNKAQHPLAHNIDDFAYTHPAFGGMVTNLQQALDWICAVLYPTQKSAVADVASLPAAGNSIGDMRVVNDDGDGLSASYRWEQREGDATPKWYKIYDVDFSTDSILAAWTNVTQDVYATKYGRNDTDSNGLVITGLLAGQSIYGGKTANTNLNLFANSGDGVGANTGFIQAGDNVRPLSNNTFTLGTATYRWSDFHAVRASIGDFQLLDDTIDSTTGLVDFLDNDLLTTGFVSAEHVTAIVSASAFASGTTIGNITVSNGSIVSSGGTISFGSNGIQTTGTGQIGLINISGNSIDSDNTVIDFNFNDLVDVGDVTAQNGFFDTLSIGGTLVDLIIDTNGNISKAAALSMTSAAVLTLTGTTVALTGNVTASNTIVAQGKVSAPQLEAVTGGRSILIGGATNVIQSTGAVLDINSSTGVTLTAPSLTPTGATTDIGSATNLFRDVYLSGSLRLAGGNSIGQAALSALRNVAVSPANGDTLFWDAGTSSWVASHPDTEVDHGEINGLLDDDHTQYAMLAGRAGGQVLTGGTAANNNLVLASTSNVTKGNVLWRDVLAPETDGTDLGTLARQIGDSYFKGQAKGFRLENFTTVTLPSASAAKTGRAVFDTTAKTLLVDDGGTWRRAGAEKYLQVDAVGWNGSVLTLTYTVSSTMQDATKAIWDFCLTSTGERLYPVITKTTTQVTVTFKMPPPAASYTLIGVA